jgi:uncharacterized protein YjbI with pentapeptide repeats
MKTYTEDELKEVLKKHLAWRLGEEGGERANLDGANLYGASLDGANLDGANLYGANLYRANLYGASLDGANLDGANLDGASCRHTKGLIIFYGPDYQITATKDFVRIGCEVKTRAEWLAVTEDEACEMGLNRENFPLYRAFIEILPAEFHSGATEEKKEEAVEV